MDNPRQAGAALRAHAQAHGLPLEGPMRVAGASAAGKAGAAADRAREGQVGIRLFGTTLPLPAAGVEPALAERLTRMAAESRGNEVLTAIVQLREGAGLGDVADLLEAGVKVCRPLGARAAVVRMAASTAQGLAGWPQVHWIGEYKPWHKLAPTVDGPVTGGALLYALEDDGPGQRADLARLGITVRSYDAERKLYDVSADAARLDAAAALEWVDGIVPQPREVLQALNYEPDDSRELVLAFATSYTGAGVPVGVRDAGINVNHPDLAGHVLAGSDTQPRSAHGTHVCSILMGRGLTDIEGTYDGKGVAFGSDVLFKNLSSSYAAAFAAWQAAGVQISNHSYSFAGDAYAYDANTAAFDDYADKNDAVIVAACGDGGTNVTNPALGKNVLAVGAVCYVANATEQVGRRAGYSNPGPARDDRRLKPELVAPGGGADGASYGVVGANDTPDGIAGGAEWPGNDLYVRMSGTSMAGPHVAGVCAKIKQWMPAIHSELLKALLINTAIPLKENTGDPLGGYPSTAVGYGLVNGYSVTDAYAGESQRVLFVEDWIYDGIRTPWTLTVPAGAKQLIVTLAYNDLGGAANPAHALRDYLDVSLTSPEGWTVSGHYGHMPAGADGSIPLQKIVIPNPSAGTWVARVEFTYAAAQGDPLLAGPQRYGLVGHVLLKTPALSVQVAQSLYDVTAGSSFVVQPTVTNTGGYIAAGVTAKVAGPAGFGGEVNVTRMLGSLPHQNAAASAMFTLVAPQTAGTYMLSVEADGANREFAAGYPRTQTFTVKVRSPGVVVPPVEPLDSPIGVSASDGPNPVHISWMPVSGFGYYRVWRATSETGVKTALTSWQEMDSYDDPAASPGVVYCYWVQAAANANGYRASGYGNFDTGSCEQASISGHVRKLDGGGLAGVVMAGLPGEPMTDAQGYYSAAVPVGWTGTVTPQRAGLGFTPPSRSYSNVVDNLTGQDYTTTVQTVRISGTVRDKLGAGMAGVPLGGFPEPVVTDATGFYQAVVEYNWSGAAAPMRPGFRFTPQIRTYLDVKQDLPLQDYTQWQGLDLRAASIGHVSPGPGDAAGQSIPVIVTIVNDGTEPAIGVRVDLWTNQPAEPTDPGTSDMQQVLGTLAPGEDTTATFTVMYPQPGDYTLWVMVTPLPGQVDQYMSNNVLALTLHINAAEPDLIIEGVALVPQHPPTGRDYSMSVTVRNQGTAATGPFRVDFWRNITSPPEPGTSDGFAEVAALGAGEATTLSFEIRYPRGGSYNLWVEADAAGVVREMDESNNGVLTRVSVNSLAGDVNGDGAVDSSDLLAVVHAFGSTPGSAAWDESADLNEDGQIDYADLLILAANIGSNLLTGPWLGQAAYTVDTLSSGVLLDTYGFNQSLRMEFDGSGRPNLLDLCLGEGQEVLLLPTADLAATGDSTVFPFVRQAADTGAITTGQVMARVLSVLYSQRVYSIDLQITVVSSGADNSVASGTYSRTATVLPDGTILWQGTTTLQISIPTLDTGAGGNLLALR